MLSLSSRLLPHLLLQPQRHKEAEEEKKRVSLLLSG
jgi:hypothetical protein